MSYQVIARKWRPQTFEEVTGQEAITQTLRNAIEHDRLHHAYMFSGARGVGKTTTARLLAKALNCHKSTQPTVSPCSFNDANACASCIEIAEGRSIDVLEFDAASNTQVDKIRDLIIENVNISPARDRYKIFIIDEVHMLSNSSFNALLKTLEEPPPRVVFIMATTELHKLPDTILSRCQQFEFRTIALKKIFERLKLIAEAEKIQITDAALREIARAGEGSMRDAQSAFDQVISFSGESIDTKDIIVALGVASAETLGRVIKGIAEQKPSEAVYVVEELVSRGQDLRNFCRDLLTHFRDLLVFKTTEGAENLLESAGVSREELQNQAENFSESDLIRFFHSLAETEARLREANNPRYQLEIGLIKLMEMNRVAPFEKILARLTKLENALQKTDLANLSADAEAEKKTLEIKTAPQPFFAPTSNSAAAFAPQKEILPTKTAVPSAEPEEDTAPWEEVFKPQAKEEKAVEHSEPTTNVLLEKVSAQTDKEINQTFSSATETSSAAETPNALPTIISNADQPPDFPPLAFEEEPEYEIAPPSDLVEKKPANGVRQKLLDGLEKRSQFLLVAGIECAKNVSAMPDGTIYLEFTEENAHWKERWERPEHTAILREIGKESNGRDWKITVQITGHEEKILSPEEKAERLAKEELWKKAEANPLVQDVLRIFRGEIVDVFKRPEAAPEK